MLPSDLNRFTKYLHSTATLDEEHLAELLVLLQDNLTRSKYIMTIDKLHNITRPVKPHVEVHQYMTTNAKYIEDRIVITSYYTGTAEQEILERIHMKLTERLDSQPIMLYLEEYTPAVVDTRPETMIGEN